MMRPLLIPILKKNTYLLGSYTLFTEYPHKTMLFSMYLPELISFTNFESLVIVIVP